MRKRLALFIALLLVLTAALPVIAACNTDKTVTNLKFIDPKTSYTEGDTIDYDSLKVEITYEDQSKETKTVKELKSLGATLTEADLSKQGNTYYALSYKGTTARVDISVAAKNVDVKDEVTVVLYYHDGKTNPVTVTLDRNTALGDKLPANPTREGYTFEGWYTEETGGTKWEASSPVQGNTLNLHAQWKLIVKEKVTVTFHANDGSADDALVTLHVNKGTALAKLPADPAREGYAFAGWFTQATEGSQWNLETTVDGTLDLYAQWTTDAQGAAEPAQVTVVLHYHDNVTSDELVVVDKGAALGNKLPAEPTRVEHTFDGWYTEEQAGYKWTAESNVDGNIDLYARWLEVGVEYVTVTLMFHDDKTDNLVLNNIIKGSTLGDLLPADITRTNYEFLGWFTAETGGTEWKANMAVNEDKTLHAQWHQTVVPPTVARFAVPKEYQKYIDASKPLTGEESKDDFRIRGEAYEVGNVNRFVFDPVFEVIENGEPTEKTNPTTIAKVYTKATAAGTYTELTGAAKDAFVTKIGNTYRFGETATGGTYVKMEISLDTQSYDVPSSINNLLTVEFVLVDGGYNVYDQFGLSVMADLEKRAWSEIWRCTTEVEGNTVKCIANSNSRQLPWDDDFLCNYVDKVSSVIIHKDIKLDPDQMPSLYFWSKEGDGKVTSDMYTEAWNSIKSIAPFSTGEDTLEGTLRGGYDSATENDRNYMRVIDTYESGEETGASYKVNGQQSIETGIWLNMQKGLFATKKVSVSGNYQSLTTPEKGERSSTYKRLLEVYVDWNHPTGPEAPDTVYSVFHMLQSQREGAEVANFAIKNLAMKGNNPKANTSGFVSAGLMILDSYNMKQAYYNVNASQFCRMMSGDDYGQIHVDGDGKVVSTGGTALDAIVSFEGVKFYEAYSNMFAMWRSTVDIKNSEMKGSGGPLFIMNDGTRYLRDNSDNTDASGCELTVDEKSVLQAYATGGENWYVIWKAQALFSNIGSSIEPVMNGLGKTLQTDQNGNKYYNVIAAMICTPGNLFDGDGASNKDGLIDVRGTYKQYGETYAMHNQFLVGFRSTVLNAGGNASMFAPIIQSGSNVFALTGSFDASSYGYGIIPRIQRANGDSSTNGNDVSQIAGTWQAEAQAWASNTSKLACIYMSASTIPDSPAKWAPYFGIILELNNKAQA